MNPTCVTGSAAQQPHVDTSLRKIGMKFQDPKSPDLQVMRIQSRCVLAATTGQNIVSAASNAHACGSFQRFIHCSTDPIGMRNLSDRSTDPQHATGRFGMRFTDSMLPASLV